MKKVWEAPKMEVLNISETMLGEGTHYVDWSYAGGKLDLDITDDPSSGIPAPSVPGAPVS